ncbi:flagellar assembly peptidoglycan hydrolase FlgJ [Azoarcus olearius]|uniref:Peptidoglycan hydrolase FlgJ n=1 Tax=Azoarcus sp. (strain BH72) TaxID=418699 RepID=A1K943_AZOSB|nr:flagellar assembly peptidoglycan hydrolase FlgJ [Azoarcus olearius]ANQ85895.1 peptidoglycan hydrolase [Azoarcus olearius]CAL95348.1 peptidoglycan hydrolase [Azoarcus olearius]
MTAANTGFQLNALDPNSLGDLKRLARNNPDSPETLRAASKQFEALFLQMALKSMREATPGSTLFDNEQTKSYQSLLDQQLALNMAHSRNNGMSEALFRQLGGINGKGAATPAVAEGLPLPGAAGANPGFDISNAIRQSSSPAALMRQAQAIAAGAESRGGADGDSIGALISRLENAVRATRDKAAAGATAPADGNDGVADDVREFVNAVWPHAQSASRQTGIPAQFIVAQAALETGWGDKVLRHADGRNSYNLFNIKAGAGWTGDTVTRKVTEYSGGSAYTEQARFRSYGSYAEAFQDYARLLANSSRYSEVLGQTSASGFARSLQQAGYATDPMYADKLTRIIGGSTLRGALSG